jgi:TRIAD3 protein (E3 ubiquitin-protein ligase RNF216)
MFEEIEKARKKLEEDRARQKKEDERREQEQEAKDIAACKGKLTECDICAEDRPPTRMASCNAKEKHTYCFTCVKTHIETMIGGGKHTATCMAVDCKGHYPRKVLEEVLDKALISRMDRLKQNDDLKGIKGIEECPFCNFKAFCEDKSRFNCQNPECEMSSCLKCKAETHPGLSCTEYGKQKKENKGGLKGLELRHLVEEAMTNALLRHCPYVYTPPPPYTTYADLSKQTMQNAIHKRLWMQQDDMPNLWHDVVVCSFNFTLLSLSRN